MKRAICAAVVALAGFVPVATADAPTEQYCDLFKLTGYVRTAPGMGPVTADGTSILTDEPIAAVSDEVPLGAYIHVHGIGDYRVADRLGSRSLRRWIDLPVWTEQEALDLTREIRACVWN